MKKLTALIFTIAFAGYAYAADINALTKKAESGDAQAMYEVGMAYMNGEGVKADETKAVQWLEKAAKKNHNEALYELGLAIFYGQGTKEDRIKGCAYLYTTTVDAAAYNCTQLDPQQRTKALEAAAALKKSLGR